MKFIFIILFSISAQAETIEFHLNNIWQAESAVQKSSFEALKKTPPDKTIKALEDFLAPQMNDSLSKLGADDFRQRKKAMKYLKLFGYHFKKEITALSQAKDPEISTRCKEILLNIPTEKNYYGSDGYLYSIKLYIYHLNENDGLNPIISNLYRVIKNKLLKSDDFLPMLMVKTYKDNQPFWQNHIRMSLSKESRLSLLSDVIKLDSTMSTELLAMVDFYHNNEHYLRYKILKSQKNPKPYILSLLRNRNGRDNWWKTAAICRIRAIITQRDYQQEAIEFLLGDSPQECSLGLQLSQPILPKELFIELSSFPPKKLTRQLILSKMTNTKYSAALLPHLVNQPQQQCIKIAKEIIKKDPKKWLAVYKQLLLNPGLTHVDYNEIKAGLKKALSKPSELDEIIYKLIIQSEEGFKSPLIKRQFQDLTSNRKFDKKRLVKAWELLAAKSFNSTPQNHSSLKKAILNMLSIGSSLKVPIESFKQALLKDNRNEANISLEALSYNYKPEEVFSLLEVAIPSKKYSWFKNSSTRLILFKKPDLVVPIAKLFLPLSADSTSFTFGDLSTRSDLMYIAELFHRKPELCKSLLPLLEHENVSTRLATAFIMSVAGVPPKNLTEILLEIQKKSLSPGSQTLIYATAYFAEELPFSGTLGKLFELVDRRVHDNTRHSFLLAAQKGDLGALKFLTEVISRDKERFTKRLDAARVAMDLDNQHKPALNFLSRVIEEARSSELLPALTLLAEHKLEPLLEGRILKSFIKGSPNIQSAIFLGKSAKNAPQLYDWLYKYQSKSRSNYILPALAHLNDKQCQELIKTRLQQTKYMGIFLGSHDDFTMTPPKLTQAIRQNKELFLALLPKITSNPFREDFLISMMLAGEDFKDIIPLLKKHKWASRYNTMKLLVNANISMMSGNKALNIKVAKQYATQSKKGIGSINPNHIKFFRGPGEKILDAQLKSLMLRPYKYLQSYYGTNSFHKPLYLNRLKHKTKLSANELQTMSDLLIKCRTDQLKMSYTNLIECIRAHKEQCRHLFPELQNSFPISRLQNAMLIRELLK